MSKENNGGSAFPVYDAGDSGAVLFEGMTLRDYFAIGYLKGMASNPDTLCDIIKVFPSRPSMDEYRAVLAQLSYQMADAMLAEREK